MNKKKCPYCASPITKRNGTRNGVQLYKCQACGRQFRAGDKVSDEQLWYLYQERKQTAVEIATEVGVSRSTISRRLKNIDVEWHQPSLKGMSGYVHLDVTYWGHNWGVLLALDDASNRPLYIAFVQAEKNSDYELAIRTIRDNGYDIRGIIIDGKRGLFTMFAAYKVQMCQYHMKQIVFRYLTKNPRLKAAVALEVLVMKLTKISKEDFINAFGEELIVDNAEKGLFYACQQTQAEVSEYTAAPVYMDGNAKCRHQWLIEFNKEPADIQEFARLLDTKLQTINSDYEAKRFKDITLQPLEIVQARPNLFNDWLKLHGKLGGQHKIPRLSNSRKTIDELLEMNKV